MKGQRVGGTRKAERRRRNKDGLGLGHVGGRKGDADIGAAPHVHRA
jgi:hypothetical protein